MSKDNKMVKILFITLIYFSFFKYPHQHILASIKKQLS